MATVALILAAAVAVAAVLWVARPLLRPETATAGPPDTAEVARLGLLDERDRALAALKELELDHRTGKITDQDYRELVGPLRREAATALRALDDVGGGPPGERRATT